MSCAQYEALEARYQAQCEQGVDSNKSTINDNDNNDDAED
jgi:hypothetical protein